MTRKFKKLCWGILQIQWVLRIGISGDRILIRNWTFDPTMEISESRIEKFGKDQI